MVSLSKRKVLFFHHCSTIGGAGISGLNVLKAIPSSQYEVTVYCRSDASGMAEIFQQEGFNVIFAGNSPVSFSHYSGGEVFVFSPRFLLNVFEIILDRKRIRKTLEEVKPDIVIINSMTLFWIGEIAKRFKVQTICFFRESYANGLFGLRNKVIRVMLGKYFDKVSFISHFEKNKSKEVKCFKTVIYNMIPYQDFLGLDKIYEAEQLGLNSENFNVLFVGGMSRLKGTYNALKALALVSNLKINLVIVGFKWDGMLKNFKSCKTIRGKLRLALKVDYEANCIRYIIEKKLKSRVHFYATTRNIIPFYAACNALVSPSTKPHQSRPIFEAGFARIPVIATDFPETNEFIDNHTGYLFKNGNFAHLARILDELSFKPQFIETKIENNLKRSYQRHAKEIFNPRIVELLKSL